ncbi:MAG: thioredoxin domain-containing protein [Arachnia sp.]
MTSKRAELRRQQEAAAQGAKTRRIVVAGIVLLALTVVVVFAVVIIQALNRPGAEVAQQTPPNATAGHGILLSGKAPRDGVPHLVIWGDYLCPACASIEQGYGPVVDELVAEGSITAEVRQAYFKDHGTAYGGSKRAAMAAAAADAVGHFDAYHAALFAQQSTGYPNALLREELPAQVGIEGDDLKTFQKLYDDRAFDTWTAEADTAFTTGPYDTTPSYIVGDTVLTFYDQDAKKLLIEPTKESLLAAIEAAQ